MCKRSEGGVAFGSWPNEPRARKRPAEGDTAHEGADHRDGEPRQGRRGRSLEAFARQGVQDLLQRMLEEEVAAMLGRRRYARRAGVDATGRAIGTGYGKPRRLSLSVGTITLRRPRVRGLEERFESRLLPLFKRRTEAVGQLLPQLYLHGLALGDFDWPCADSSGTARRCRPPRSPG